MLNDFRKMYFAPDDSAGDPPKVEEKPDDSFEVWFSKQPQEVQDKFKAQYGNLEKALDAERKQSKDAKGNAKKLAEYEAAEQKRAEEQLSKEQLLEKQNAEFKAQAEKIGVEAEAKLLKAAFLLKAKDLGFENPADAFALADKTVVKKLESGDFDEASIEIALKPLIGRLPVKQQGDGKGTPKFPAAKLKETKSEIKGRVFNRPF